MCSLSNQLPTGTYDLAQLLGWYECCFFIFNTYMTVCALMLDTATLTVFVFLELTLLFVFTGHFNPDTVLLKVGGYFGVFTAIAGKAVAQWTLHCTCPLPLKLQMFLAFVIAIQVLILFFLCILQPGIPPLQSALTSMLGRE